MRTEALTSKIRGMSTLAERVFNARNEAGLNQSQLARLCGVTPQAIQKVESGITKRPKFILDLARALNVSPDWLSNGAKTTLSQTLPKDSASESLADFAYRVMEARRRQQLSIERAARAIMPTSTWSEMEMGRYWPNPLELDFICLRLGESSDWLVRGLVEATEGQAPREPHGLTTLHAKQTTFLPKGD